MEAMTVSVNWASGRRTNYRGDMGVYTTQKSGRSGRRSCSPQSPGCALQAQERVQ